MNAREFHLQCAKYGMEIRQLRFPLGALNRKDNFDKNPKVIIEHLKLLSNARDKLFTSESIALLQGGFCWELAGLIRKEILKKFPAVCIELASLKHHQFIVIGRKKGDTLNIKEWGDEAVICDPWADEVYLATEFESKQKGNAIPFYQFFNGINLDKKHYLEGAPRIIPQSNFHKDFISETNLIKYAALFSKQGSNYLDTIPETDQETMQREDKNILEKAYR